MAETITRQLREPFVESAGLGITDRGLQLLKTPIPTATYTGRQFVQDQSALEQQATAAAAGLDSLVGPDAYKQFMSPYQQEVIDTSLAAMDREQQKGIASLRQRAAQAGAFGGGREAASLGEYQATADIARAVEEARLREARISTKLDKRQQQIFNSKTRFRTVSTSTRCTTKTSRSS